MTEQEWLSSNDPGAMLRCFKPWSGGEGFPRPSDRKLRLLVQACRAWHGCKVNLHDIYTPGGLDDAVRDWSTLPDFPGNDIAAMLGDVVGNPWRKVEAHHGPPKGLVCPNCDGLGWFNEIGPNTFPVTCRKCKGEGKRVEAGPPRTSWLTDTAVSLARAAYDELPGRRCRDCLGGKAERRYVHEGGLHHATNDCLSCGGTGHIEDGRLDPARLAVLADALEEAGCPAEEGAECPDCSPYKDDPDNHWPGKLGYRPARDVASGRHEGGWGNCYRCNGGGKGHWRPGFVLLPNPLLAHLRSPGPHVRGCWALDLILGKE